MLLRRLLQRLLLLRRILRLLVMLRLRLGAAQSRHKMALRLLVMLLLWRRVRLKRRRMGQLPLRLALSPPVTPLRGPRRMLLRLPPQPMALLPLPRSPLLLLPVPRRTLRRPLLLLHSRRGWLLLPLRMLLMVCGRSCRALCPRLRVMRRMLLILRLLLLSPHRMRRLWCRMVCRMRRRR